MTGHPSDGPPPRKPSNPICLAVILVFYAAGFILVTAQLLRLLEKLLT